MAKRFASIASIFSHAFITAGCNCSGDISSNPVRENDLAPLNDVILEKAVTDTVNPPCMIRFF